MISRLHRRLFSVQRSSAFSALLKSDIDHFKSFLPKKAVLTDPDDLVSYNEDWMGKFKGNTQLVLCPSTTDQVSRILQHCNERKLAVVPQGGNTGLVGGSNPVFDEIVVSLRRMNKIMQFDELSGIVSVEAGVIKEELDNYLQERGYILPFDLGARVRKQVNSQGSCMIGGNLATNAGGVRMIKYGSLRGNTVGLKAVLPNGEVIDNMKGLLKDNTGYDLKQFFIGSEGTLGIITEGQILCPVVSQSQSVAMLACRDFQKVLNILRRAKRHLGGYLSAIQFFDSYCLNLVMEQMQKPNPIEGDKIYPFYVILEASSSDTSGVDQELLGSLLETELVQEMEDGVLSQDYAQFREIWEYRESIAQAGKRLGYNYKYDLSLSRDRFYDLVEALRERCGDKAYTVGYGHIGDGNLHINVVVRGYEDKGLQKEVGEIIEPYTFDFIRDEKGSVSAEHGIGYTKPRYLGHSKSPEAIAMMKSMKAAIDPNGIMNPYKLFPVQNSQKKRRFE